MCVCEYAIHGYMGCLGLFSSVNVRRQISTGEEMVSDVFKFYPLVAHQRLATLVSV